MMHRVRTSLPQTVLIALAALVAPVAPGQSTHATPAPQVQYSITGTLISSTDGSPVPHGHLIATLVGTGTQQGRRSSSENTFDADDQGHFTLQLPSAGMWNITAWGRGFVRNGYLGHEQFSSGVVLTREHPATEIQFTLDPQAEITGIVTDEAGEAVRGARISLMRVQTSSPDGPAQTITRSTAQTDDRGMYEFDDLEPGNYRLSVAAQPWYAAAAARGQHSDSDPPLDPSLDVAYPVTWFPGSADPYAAETLTLKGGDVREADVHLQPIPALHLIIDPPAPIGDSRNMRYFPIVQRVDSGGFFLQPMIRTNAQGQIDVGGLTPGLYQVQLLGPGAPNLRSLVRVTGSGEQTVSFDGASNEAEVSVQIEGIDDDEARTLSVSLLDPDGRPVATTARGRVEGFAGFGQRTAMPSRGAGRDATHRESREDQGTNRTNRQEQPERVLHVPPGKYEVVIRMTHNDADLYLSGITAKGAQAAGRQVTLPSGASTLTLHVVEGRATLTGMVARNGKPSIGTLVMLVPATLDQPGAIQFARRDESNTDGSFNIADIIPGQYILLAVENGWNINWKDKATLARYLDGGVAVSLAAKSNTTQNITAQQP